MRHLNLKKLWDLTSFCAIFILYTPHSMAAAASLACGSSGKTPEELVNIFKDRKSYPDFYLVCAHRGLWINRLNPQNSENSLKSAIEAGIDCDENDIKPSKDGIFYIFHDTHTDMLVVDENGSPVKGRISDYTSSQLDKFFLRDRNFNKTDNNILRLSRFIEIAKGKIVENHEIKLDGDDPNRPLHEKQQLGALLKILKTEGVLNESILKGRLSPTDYQEILVEAGLRSTDVTYVPKFFYEDTPERLHADIAAFRSLGVKAYELVIESDDPKFDNLRAVIPDLDAHNERYGQFDIFPESGRGHYTWRNTWVEMHPERDFRGNWDWLFSSQNYSFVISDHPCLLTQYLLRLGKREL